MERIEEIVFQFCDKALPENHEEKIIRLKEQIQITCNTPLNDQRQRSIFLIDIFERQFFKRFPEALQDYIEKTPKKETHRKRISYRFKNFMDEFNKDIVAKPTNKRLRGQGFMPTDQVIKPRIESEETKKKRRLRLARESVSRLTEDERQEFATWFLNK